MTDVTQSILEAGELDPNGNFGKVRRALEALARLFPGAVVDWEEGDEKWGCVVSHDAAVAYVTARFPLAFAQVDEETALENLFPPPGMVVIRVRNFDAPCLSVDPSVLFQVGQGPLSENVQYDRASVNDLWWATV